MSRILLFVFLLAAGALPGNLSAQAAAPPAPTLRPGDAIRITVWRKEELSGEFPIAEDGSITHPLYRELKVAGMPLPEVEARLRQYLERLESSPQFVIHPLFRVSVGGEVREPNLYALPPETTIAQAVALAGGASDRGRLDRVRLFREGQEVRVDLTAPQAGLAQATVRSGDQIFVERRVSVFREYIAPAGSITAALAAIASIIINANK